VRAAKGDARELEGRWDAAVIDLPYGHTSVADDQLYLDVVGNVARRVKRLAVVDGPLRRTTCGTAWDWRQGRAKVPGDEAGKAFCICWAGSEANAERKRPLSGDPRSAKCASLRMTPIAKSPERRLKGRNLLRGVTPMKKCLSSTGGRRRSVVFHGLRGRRSHLLRGEDPHHPASGDIVGETVAEQTRRALG